MLAAIDSATRERRQAPLSKLIPICYDICTQSSSPGDRVVDALSFIHQLVNRPASKAGAAGDSLDDVYLECRGGGSSKFWHATVSGMHCVECMYVCVHACMYVCMYAVSMR